MGYCGGLERQRGRQKENKLTGSDLSVGQRLVIPVRRTVADVIAEQNERNVGRAQLAAK